MKKYRVAICFRGLIRTGIENRPSFKFFFEDSEWTVDYFCHTWDYDNVAPPFLESPLATTELWSELRSRPTSVLSPFKLNKFKNIYNFKKIKVENFEKFRVIENRNTTLPNDEFILPYHPQFVSAYKVNELKRQYEEEHDFKYDLVINTRADIIVNPNHKDNFIFTLLRIKDSMYSYIGLVNLHSNWSYEDSFYDDVMYAGRSENMDLFTEYFNPSLNTEQHNFIGRYAKKVNLEFIPIKVNYTILRNYQSFYHPIKEYIHIFIGNLLMYFSSEDIETLLRGYPEAIPLYEQTLKEFIQ